MPESAFQIDLDFLFLTWNSKFNYIHSVLAVSCNYQFFNKNCAHLICEEQQMLHKIYSDSN